MRKLIIASLAAGSLFVAGCATSVSTHKVDANRVVLCDTGPGDCSGANPEKGIEKVCLPKRSIVAIDRDGTRHLTGQQQGIVVTCGPALK